MVSDTVSGKLNDEQCVQSVEVEMYAAPPLCLCSATKLRDGARGQGRVLEQDIKSPKISRYATLQLNPPCDGKGMKYGEHTIHGSIQYRVPYCSC
ncbi:hypothetical protein VZT92_007144 [Zoarces viviparus]